LNRSNGLALFWALIICLLLAHTAYLWLKQRIVPNTNILALLPADRRDPVLQQAFVHMIDLAQQQLVVLIGATEWREARRAAGTYRQVIEQHSHLVELKNSTGQGTVADWLVSFQPHRLGLMEPRDEQALRKQPVQFWTDTALGMLYSPFGALALGAWRDDPFGIFAAWARARAQETPVRPRNGWLFVADGQREYVVMPMTLHVPAFSTAGQDALVPVLDQAVQAARSEVSQVEVLQAGIVLHAAVAGAQAHRELSVIGLGSIAGVVLLMWLTFHSLKPVALIFLPIAIGCIGALSVCWFVFDKIHLITLVFGASLIGVAQDYGIYFLCQRAAADSALDSWRLMRRILVPLALTLVTTLIGYMGLLVTPFPGLSQMAIFSVSGLIFAWLTVILCFPALVRVPPTIKIRLPEPLGWPVVGRDRRSSVAASLFIIFAVFGLARLDVKDDVRLLQNSPKNLIDDQLKVSRLLNLPAPGQFYLVRGGTPDLVLQREETLKRRLDRLIEQRSITRYHAISNWVPSAELQTARHNLVERALLKKDGALAALAAKLGEDQIWVEATRERLLASARPFTTDDFFKSPASEPWRYLWIGKVGDAYASIVALSGVGRASLAGLGQAGSGLDGVQWVDRLADISSLLGNYRRYMSWVLMLSYATVYGLLYPRYRSASWRVLAPTALASISTVAFLGLAGQSLQLFHVLALMLLLGIGVDYGIFFQEQGQHRDPVAALAVGLSALSTLLSFGLLGLSTTPALQAFGMTMAIGITAVWLLVPCFRIEQQRGASAGTEASCLSTAKRRR
jgi:predicted exporter